MKTTVEIADELFREAKEVAATQKTTLRSLIEDGLRMALERRREGSRFVLRDESFGGEGLQQEVEGASFGQLRELAYKDRGR